MKLTVETIRVKDMRFGEETCLRDGVLFVNKEDILAFAQHETCFETLKIDITYPGDSTRIINVVDVVQPRCKVSDNIDWPGVLTDDYEIAGSGVTRAVEGAGNSPLPERHLLVEKVGLLRHERGVRRDKPVREDAGARHRADGPRGRGFPRIPRGAAQDRLQDQRSAGARHARTGRRFVGNLRQRDAVPRPSEHRIFVPDIFEAVRHAELPRADALRQRRARHLPARHAAYRSARRRYIAPAAASAA